MRLRLELRPLHVEGKAQPDRTGSPGCCRLPRLLERVGHCGRIRNLDSQLGDRPRHRHNVDLLRSVLAPLRVVGHELGPNLARDNDDGDRVDPRPRDGGQRIGRAWTCRHQAYTWGSEHTRVAFRGDGACLLVVVAPELGHSGAAHGIDQVHDPASADHEEVIDPPVSQEPHHVLGDVHLTP